MANNLPYDAREETCARCGHQTPECPNCDRRWPFLGACVNGAPLCHTFVEVGRSCYEVSSFDFRVVNQVTGTVHGTVVQTGDVAGGLSL